MSRAERMQAMYDLHQAGGSWGSVASKFGYVNGYTARRALQRWEELYGPPPWLPGHVPDFKPDQPEPKVTPARPRARGPWNRTPPGGPGIGDSVCFDWHGKATWGLLVDREADGTLQLVVMGDSVRSRTSIAPGRVTRWEAGRARSGVPLPLDQQRR